MSIIAENIHFIQAQLPSHVQLVCVSKYHSIQAIQDAYAAGQRIFGESKVQEMNEKQHLLPKDIHWHFIGHLQSNKVKYIVPYVSLIHAVDSDSLLKEINKQGKKNNRIVNCLLQVHVAKEQTKFGFSPDELTTYLRTNSLKQYPYANICGIMGMASNTDDQNQIRAEFQLLKNIFQQAKKQSFENDPSFQHLSMGMSGDYQIAIEEGSTYVRVGSSIFGPRLH